MLKSALKLQWLPNRAIMGQESSYMIAEHSPRRVFGFVGRNATALSYEVAIVDNLRINLSSEASICHKDAVYTKSKSGPFGPLTLQAQITVVDHKERGMPKV